MEGFTVTKEQHLDLVRLMARMPFGGGMEAPYYMGTADDLIRWLSALEERLTLHAKEIRQHCDELELLFRTRVG